MSLIGEERKRSIMDILDIRGKATVNYLSEKLEVSTETVRKYLEELEQENKLKKVYGGAILIESDQEEPPYFKREVIHAEEKRSIGKKAVEFINDNDVIVLDEGSTVLQMIRYLVNKQNITVCTNSFPAATLLIDYANRKLFNGSVIFLGGAVNLQHMRVSGLLSEQMMSSFLVDKAFISVDGISLQHGFTSLEAERGMLSAKMMEQARESYVLADSSKLGERGLYRMADLGKVHAIISNIDAPEAWKSELSAKNIRWEFGAE